MSIKVITEPTIHLVGTQQANHEDLAEFLDSIDANEWSTDCTTDAEALPEIAGRLCYLSFKSPRPGGNAAYLNHILEVGHGSVLEHAVFNFIITGVSRSLTHELVRHRAGFGFSELSQRYVDSSDVAFVAPPAMVDEILEGLDYVRIKDGDLQIVLLHWLRGKLPESTKAGIRWVTDMVQSRNAYVLHCDYLEQKFAHIEDRTARRKAAREAARSVLPNCAETKIFVTANARALRHFIELRGDGAADAEIRRLAVALLRVTKGSAPNIFGDYEVIPCPLGGEMVSTPHRKV